MSILKSKSISDCACDCGTGQTNSTIACPTCRKLGSTVKPTTPRHCLKKQARARFDVGKTYHFCENPDCDVAYYNEQDSTVFSIWDLKNRVTIKDDSPETPLCYCFKVLKKQALEEITRTGTTDVLNTIRSKMKPGQGCFCEKSNPRGDTCVKDIQGWLDKQGITTAEQVDIEQPSNGSCCE